MVMLGVARADEPDNSCKNKEAENSDEDARVIEVPETGRQVELPLTMGKITLLQFDEPITRGSGKPQGIGLDVLEDEKRVAVWPTGEDDEGRSVPVFGNFIIQSPERAISFDTRLADRDEKVDHVVAVQPLAEPNSQREDKLEATEREAAKAKAEAAQARTEAIEANAKAVQAERKAARAKEAAAKAMAEAAKAREAAAKAQAEATKAKAEAAKANQDAAQAKARERAARDFAGEQRKAAERALFQLLTNAARNLVNENPKRLTPQKDESAFTAGRLSGRFNYADWKNGYFLFDTELENPPGRAFNLADAKAHTLAGEELQIRTIVPDAPTSDEPPNREVIVTIPSGEKKRVVFVVEMPPDTPAEHLQLQLFEQGSKEPPLTVQTPRYNGVATAILVAVGPKTAQRMRWAEQLVVGSRISYGACWLTSTQGGEDDMEATGCLAAGAYLAKGLHKYFAVEFEALGGATGDASFESQTRSARFGRFTARGALRLAEGETVPFFGFGIGLQGTSYDDPDSDFDVAAFFTFGGGLLYRLGEHWSIRVDASYSETREDGFYRTLEGGASLSYGWN